MRAVRRFVRILGLALCVLALVQASHRARAGRSALLKWIPAQQALQRGEPLYEVGEEGYPTLPLTLLAMKPFHALGPLVGASLWSLAQVACAAWIVITALALAAGRASLAPPWAQLVIGLLSFRVLLSDVLHGNINVFVGAILAAAARDWAGGRETRAGAWVGLAAVAKLTPLLFLALFVAQRSGRALAGAAASLAFFAFLLPGWLLGFSRNLDLVSGWSRQMVLPYLSAAPLSLRQTEQINQSLLGVMARHLTPSVAIEARPPVFPRDVFINWAALDPGAFRGLHLAAVVLVLAGALAAIGVRRRGAGPVGGLTALGQFSVLSLAMVLVSERSWKHHWVLLAFPLAFLVRHVYSRGDRLDGIGRGTRGIAAAAVLASALAHGLSGSGVLGARGSDLAEAYGVWMAGGLVLLLASGLVLRRSR